MKKFLKVLLGIVIVLGLFWGVVNIAPTYKVTDNNPWRKNDNVLISAHRGGADLNPENTKMAFDYVIKETSYTDIVEIDLMLTADNYLVINHDKTLNKLALPEGSPDVTVATSTYKELSEYNLGRNFVARDLSHPYENYTIEQAKENGLTIMLFDDFLKEYKECRDIRLFVEIKEPKERCEDAVDAFETIVAKEENAWWDERIMMISLTAKAIEYSLEKYPNRYVGALGFGMAPQLVGSLLCLDSLFKSKYQCIQTSMITKAGPIEINCATKRFVNSAHKRNQSVVYWTINEEDDMRFLIELGTDIITTDCPDVLAKVIGKI